MLTQEELDRLNRCNTEQEWNKTCDDIKRAHRGYPDDWHSKVIASGLVGLKSIQFGR